MKTRISLVIVLLFTALSSLAQINLKEAGKFRFKDHKGDSFILTLQPSSSYGSYQVYVDGKSTITDESSGEIYYGYYHFIFPNASEPEANATLNEAIIFSESVPIGWNMRQLVYQDYDNGYPLDKLGISEDGWLYPNITECNIESPKHRLKLTKIE